MVQLLQAVARPVFHNHDEFTLQRAHLQDGTVQRLESVCKASINTANDIPRENLQPTVKFLSSHSPVLAHILLPISSINGGGDLKYTQGAVRQKGAILM